ncbi:MAG: RHS repeat protein, partial [Sphingomonadales bacterium]|nr:RHS repeat protein [Sphingomonadales bacterium]
MRPADTRFTTEAKPAEPRSTRKSALFRAAALATTMLCPGLAAPAFAQTADVPQARVNLDENGVDVATGKFHYQTEEGAIGSGSDRITIQRAWNAAGWQDNIVGTLRRTTPASGQRRITMEFGLRSISFIRTGSGAFVSESGEGGTLTEAADGASYTYTAANGSVYHYGNPEPLPDPDPSLDDTKFCTSTSEAACFALPLTRQSSDGLLLNFQWDVYPSCKIIKNTFVVCTEYARLERVFDNAGLEAEIDYVSDATYNNRPVAEWYKRSKVDFRTATNATPAATIGYAYPDAVTTQVTGPDNGVTVYKQDGAGRLASIQRPGETTPGLTIAYQTDNRVSQVTRDGVIKSYSWSTYNGDTVLNTSGGPNGPETIVSNPNLKQPKTTTDANGAVLSHQYDSFGRVSLTTYPEGNSVGFAYDSRGNVTQTTYYPKPGSGLGNIVVEAGYSSGCPDMDTCNSPLWTDDADDNRTDYTYDATHGQVTKVERPAPAPGQPRPTTNSSYTALYTQYRNANGTLVNSGTPQYKPTLVTSCATAAACPGSADETRVTMEYNHPNLYLTKVTTASGDGSLSASTEYSYDRAGRVSIIDGPLAGTADRIYQYHDDKSRLIGRVYPDPDGAGPRQRRAEYYAYRQDGQRQSVKIGTTGATDLTGITVANELVSQFDAQGRKTHDRYYAGSAATGTLQSVNQYSYDANGRLDCSAQRMNPASWSALPASACTLA